MYTLECIKCNVYFQMEVRRALLKVYNFTVATNNSFLGFFKSRNHITRLWCNISAQDKKNSSSLKKLKGFDSFVLICPVKLTNIYYGAKSTFLNVAKKFKKKRFLETHQELSGWKVELLHIQCRSFCVGLVNAFKFSVGLICQINYPDENFSLTDTYCQS